MAIQEGPDSVKEKAIKTAWPVEEGLTAGTTKQVGPINLKPEDSLVIRKRPGWK